MKKYIANGLSTHSGTGPFGNHKLAPTLRHGTTLPGAGTRHVPARGLAREESGGLPQGESKRGPRSGGQAAASGTEYEKQTSSTIGPN